MPIPVFGGEEKQDTDKDVHVIAKWRPRALEAHGEVRGYQTKTDGLPAGYLRYLRPAAPVTRWKKDWTRIAGQLFSSVAGERQQGDRRRFLVLPQELALSLPFFRMPPRYNRNRECASVERSVAFDPLLSPAIRTPESPWAPV